MVTGTKRSATVKAKTFTALARLSAEHFDEVLVRFPHELKNAFRGFDLMGRAVRLLKKHVNYQCF